MGNAATRLRPRASYFIWLAMASIYWPAVAWAGALKSAAGSNINFDMGNDGAIEMRLTSVGLGIGISPSANLHVSGNAVVSSNIYVGTTGGNGTLYMQGCLEITPENISANATLSNNSTLIFANTSSSNITLTLPYAGNVAGRTYMIKKNSNSYTLSLQPSSNDTIDGFHQLGLGAASSGLPSVSLLSAAGNWHVTQYSGNIGPEFYANLVIWLKCDEKSGAICYDSSSYRQHGTVTNTQMGVASTTGVIDGGISTDGTNDYIACGNAVQPRNNFSFGAWLKCTTTHAIDAEATTGTLGQAGECYAFDIDQCATASGIGLSAGTNGLAVYEHGNTFLPTPCAYVSPIGTGWNHVFVVVSASAGYSTIFLNGVDVHTGQNTGRGTFAPFQFGGNPTQGYGYFAGSMDDIRVYDRALTDLEVLTIYNGGTTTYSSNLIGWWKMDDTSGTSATESSGSASGNAGTLMGGFNFSANTAAGQLGNALSFDGMNDYVDIGDMNNKLDAVSAFTVSAWAYRGSASASGNIFTKYNGATNNISLTCGGSPGGIDDVKFDVSNAGTTYGYTTGNIIGATTWVHVAAVYDGTQTGNAYRAKIYINGAMQTLTFSGTIPASTNSSSNTVMLGARIGATTVSWEGRLDDVRVYTRALSAWEVLQLYNGTN